MDNINKIKNMVQILESYKDRMGVIIARSGMGKTYSCKKVAASQRWIYTALNPMITPKVFLRNVLKEISGEKYISMNMTELYENIINSQVKGIIIDEIDTINITARFLEIIRSLSDNNIPLLLVGTHYFDMLLKKGVNRVILNRFVRRVIIRYTIGEYNSDDIEKIIKGFGIEEYSKKALDFLVRLSKKENLGRVVDLLRNSRNIMLGYKLNTLDEKVIKMAKQISV